VDTGRGDGRDRPVHFQKKHCGRRVLGRVGTTRSKKPGTLTLKKKEKEKTRAQGEGKRGDGELYPTRPPWRRTTLGREEGKALRGTKEPRSKKGGHRYLDEGGVPEKVVGKDETGGARETKAPCWESPSAGGHFPGGLTEKNVEEGIKRQSLRKQNFRGGKRGTSTSKWPFCKKTEEER